MQPNIVFIANIPISTIFIVNSSIAMAAMYKWVDEDGNTHYTQSPPPEGIESKVLKQPPKIDDKDTSKSFSKQQEYIDKAREKRQKNKEVIKKAEADKAFNQENCRRARARLASYSIPRARILQSDGSRILPSEDERQKEIAKSNEMIKEWCQ